MRVRFNFSDHIQHRAKELDISVYFDGGCSLFGFGRAGATSDPIDALAEECRQLGLSVTGPGAWPPWLPPWMDSKAATKFAVVIDPMGWIDVAIPSEAKP